MPNIRLEKDWRTYGIGACTWFMWEESFPPPTHGYYGVLMADGEELAALFDKKGAWWSARMKKIVPMFWRDSADLHN